MSSRRREKRLRTLGFVGLAVLALSTAGIVASVALTPVAAPPVSDKVAEAYRSGSTATPLASAVPVAELPPLTIVPGTRAVFFGDSWTAGYGADVPKEGGFAYRAAAALGVDGVIVSGGGTGFVNPGREGKGNYLDRFKKLPIDPDVKLLVIQGGLNDENKDLGNLVPVVRDTLAEAKAKFPGAQVVVMGPLVPVRVPGIDIRIIDKTLGDLSRQAGAYYVSPQSEAWLDAQRIAELIDPAKEHHPNTLGHEYVAEQLVAAMKALA